MIFRLLSLFAFALIPLVLSGEASAQEKIYAGPSSGVFYREIAPRLMTSLYPQFRVSLETSSGSIQSIERVLADHQAIGLVQKDILLHYLSINPEVRDKVQIFGNLGPRCLFGVVREGGWVRSFEDVKRPRDDQPIRVDVGDPLGDAAASFDAMRASEKDLASVVLENRGGIRALHMVEAGLVDVAFFVEEPSLESPALRKVMSTEELRFIPVVSRNLLASDEEDGSSYTYSRVVVERNNWIRRDTSYETLCTATVILLNTEGSPAFLDAVAYASISADLEDSKPGLAYQLRNGLDFSLRLVSKMRDRF